MPKLACSESRMVFTLSSGKLSEFAHIDRIFALNCVMFMFSTSVVIDDTSP